MLVDSTLREGEQRFGVYFTAEDKRRLVTLLIRFGVEELELGVAGRDDALPELIAFARAEAARFGRRPVLSVWSPCREADLEAAAALRPDRVAVGAPVSDAHLVKRLGWTRERLLGHVRSVLSRAQALGLPSISLGLEDATRADPAFALEVARLAQSCGASRVRLSDTVGISTPLEITALVRSFRDALSIEIGLHCHDDFGMATANAVSGLVAGADSADVSILGLGERSGIAALEEVAAHLVLRRGSGAYDLSLVPALARAAAEAAGMGVPSFKAVAGRRLFQVESGLHADGVRKDPALYEPFPPEAVGLRRKLALGKKSGRAAVRQAMEEMGIDAAGADLEALTERVRRAAEERGRPLTATEARRLLSPPSSSSPRDGGGGCGGKGEGCSPSRSRAERAPPSQTLPPKGLSPSGLPIRRRGAWKDGATDRGARRRDWEWMRGSWRGGRDVGVRFHRPRVCTDADRPQENRARYPNRGVQGTQSPGGRVREGKALSVRGVQRGR